MREYFRDGKLPEPGTVCEVESKMFPDGDTKKASGASLSMSREDAEIFDAWRQLSRSFDVPRFGMQLF